MITVKRGSTFLLDAVILGDGVVIPGGIGSWSIRSQLRTKGGRLVNTFVCTITNAAACTYTIAESVAGVTADWPVEVLEMNIEYTINNLVVHTETMTVNVTNAPTRPEVV